MHFITYKFALLILFALVVCVCFGGHNNGDWFGEASVCIIHMFHCGGGGEGSVCSHFNYHSSRLTALYQVFSE